MDWDSGSVRFRRRRLTAGYEKIVEQSVHLFAPGLNFSKNHEALLSAKLNHVRLDGKPDNAHGLAMAPGAVTAGHEITEG